MKFKKVRMHGNYTCFYDGEIVFIDTENVLPPSSAYRYLAINKETFLCWLTHSSKECYSCEKKFWCWEYVRKDEYDEI